MKRERRSPKWHAGRLPAYVRREIRTPNERRRDEINEARMGSLRVAFVNSIGRTRTREKRVTFPTNAFSLSARPANLDGFRPADGHQVRASRYLYVRGARFVSARTRRARHDVVA